MTGIFDNITVTVQGNRLQLSVPEGHCVSILSDEQAHAARGSEPINSASKWLNTAARGNVLPEQTTFLDRRSDAASGCEGAVPAQ